MKNLLLFGFLLIGLLAAGCSDDDDDDDHDHDEVTIEFLEPTDGATVAAADEVHIHIRVTAEEEVHDLEIKMHPEGDESDLIIDFDAHSHESTFDFEEDYDLSSYPAGTEFHIDVRVAKDHEATEFEIEDIHFQIP
jgi:hypothetical protein